MNYIRYMLLAFSLLSQSAFADKKPAEVFMAETVLEKSEIHKGDSLLVSVVLYASQPFDQVGNAPELKVKNATVRPLRFRVENTQRRVRRDGRVLYSIVCAQYVVCPSETGTYVVPPLKIEGAYRVYQQAQTPFDDFFGVPRKYVTVKAKAATEKVSFETTPKPLRTSTGPRRVCLRWMRRRRACRTSPRAAKR